MSLTARINRLFLTAVAAILVVVTLGVYFSTRYVARRLVDSRLQSTIETLLAAIEVTDSGLEWEPQERRIRVGLEDGPAAVRWRLTDQNGKTVATSENFGPGFDESDWIRAEYSLVAPNPGGSIAPGRYVRLVVETGASSQPISASSFTAGLAALAVSFCVWITAALSSSFVTRRAIRPLTLMAETAESMSAKDLDARLPAPSESDEIGRLARAFNDLIGRVSEAYRKQGRFAGEASHQLRTPLAAIIGQAEVALRRNRDEAEYRRTLQTIVESGRHLQTVVETLLALSRPGDVDLRTQFKRIEPHQWVAEQRKRFRSHPRFADISFETLNEESTCSHPSLLSTILDNLVDNAAKHSAAGSAIEIRFGAAHDQPILEVFDRGIGVDPIATDSLFEPFVRSEEVRRLRIPGTGLGLAVVARCAETLGLLASASPRTNGGSKFRIGPPTLH